MFSRGKIRDARNMLKAETCFKIKAKYRKIYYALYWKEDIGLNKLNLNIVAHLFLKKIIIIMYRIENRF